MSLALAFELAPVVSELRDAVTATDQSLLIEKHNIIELATGHIAGGGELATVASNMGLSESDLRLLITRTATGQHRLLAAYSTRLALGSAEKLEELNDTVDHNDWSTDANNYARHHQSLLTSGIKTLESISTATKTTEQAGIVVHNTNVIASSGEMQIPKLPKELEGSIVDEQ